MARILCLGDSNTWGYDPRSYAAGQYPPAVRWTGRLGLGDRQIVSLGQNGLCIPRKADYPALGGLLRQHAPADALVVMLGTNDLLCGASAKEAAASMEALLVFLRACLPETKIVLTAPPPMERGDWVSGEALPAESRRLAGEYRAVSARCGVLFADAGEWGVGLAYDGVHFSPEGHAAFARGLGSFLDNNL